MPFAFTAEDVALAQTMGVNHIIFRGHQISMMRKTRTLFLSSNR
jgi:hypothetical protein